MEPPRTPEPTNDLKTDVPTMTLPEMITRRDVLEQEIEDLTKQKKNALTEQESNDLTDAIERKEKSLQAVKQNITRLEREGNASLDRYVGDIMKI